jgi:long-chain acyl-CoA synthetase
VDRVKNIFKLQQGEYIAPEKIESVYLKSLFLAQIFVHGNSLKNHLIAVVVPEEAVFAEWAKKMNLNVPFKQLCKSPKVKEVILADLNRLANEFDLKGFEKVNLFIFYYFTKKNKD